MANVCLVAPVKLLVTADDAAVLSLTLRRANADRSWIAERGHAERRFGRTALHRLTDFRC